MICLGIESTAHTLGIGIVDSSGRILSNIRDMYIPLRGGIHPREASDHHMAVARKLYDNAIKEAGIRNSEIELVAFSQGPGLPPCLRVGSVVARVLALKLKIPIIGVNHCIAHIEIGKLKAGFKDPVTLYVSGGNTQILAFTEGRYRIFGETQDVAIGNAIDQLAREMGFPHPGGPKVEKLASKGKWTELPYVVKGMDTSFSGILTAAIEKLNNGVRKEDVAYSFQEVAFSMLTETVERAIAHTEKNEILLTGGVAANKRLQKMLRIMAKERGSKFAVVPKYLAGDNGAMIAWTGLLAYISGQRQSIGDTKINRYWRTDQVEVTWI